MVSIDLINATLSSVDDVTTQIDEKLAGQMACELKYRNNRTEFSLMKGMSIMCRLTAVNDVTLMNKNFKSMQKNQMDYIHEKPPDDPPISHRRRGSF